MYPNNFYGDDSFGLWSADDPRVKADCELVLVLLRAYRHPDLKGKRADHNAFHHMFAWAADRCTYDLPEPRSNQDGAKGNPRWHWHTEGALTRWEANNRKHPRNNDFDHAVPQNVIKVELTALYLGGNLPDWEAVRDYLKPRRAMAVLTSEEHQLLTAEHLREAMPNPDVTNNPFARYEAIRYLPGGFTLRPPLSRQNPG